MSVATQGATLINGVLFHQRQQQHAINVSYVQILNLCRHPVTLNGIASLAPGVQVRLYSRLNDLKTNAAVASSAWCFRDVDACTAMQDVVV